MTQTDGLYFYKDLPTPRVRTGETAVLMHCVIAPMVHLENSFADISGSVLMILNFENMYPLN